MILNKVLTSVAPPLGATVGLVRAGMAACQCSTIGGGIVMAADVVASEWVNIFYFQFLKNLVNFLLQLNEMLSIIIGVPNRIAFLLI